MDIKSRNVQRKKKQKLERDKEKSLKKKQKEPKQHQQAMMKNAKKRKFGQYTNKEGKKTAAMQISKDPLQRKKREENRNKINHRNPFGHPSISTEDTNPPPKKMRK
jgi:hypothetical protein